MASLIVAQAIVTGTNGLPGLNNFYFGGGATPATAAEATDALGRVRAFFNGVVTLLATGVTITMANPVKTISDTNGALLGMTTATAPALVTGTGANELPAATMLLAQWFTSTVVGTRLLRGHSNIGPLAQVVSAGNGGPSAASRATLLASMAAFTTGATAITQRIWSRPDFNGANNGLNAPVTSFGTGAQFGVLRSRRD